MSSRDIKLEYLKNTYKDFFSAEAEAEMKNRYPDPELISYIQPYYQETKESLNSCIKLFGYHSERDTIFGKLKRTIDGEYFSFKTGTLQKQELLLYFRSIKEGSEYLLDYLQAQEPSNHIFDYSNLPEKPFDEARDQLELYVDTARIIKESVAYKSSRITLIDSLISATKPLLRYEKKSNVNYQKTEITFQKSFIAIVAPSLTGKTQTAFLLKQNRPLYFLPDFVSLASKSNSKIQGIYQNFSRLSETLRQCTILDLVAIGLGESFSDINGRCEDLRNADTRFERISTTKIQGTHYLTRFRTLGFLATLIEISEENFDPTCKQWMEFYASLDHEYQNIIHISVVEFKRKYSPETLKYFVFLDEFKGTFENVFLRNILRAAEIVCVVANTNTNVTNLLDKQQTNASRSSRAFDVWCSVVTRLDPPFSNVFSEFTNIVSKLCSKFKSAQTKDELMKYFTGIHRSLKSFSPGVFRLLVDELEAMERDFSTEEYENVTSAEVLSKIFSSIYRSLSQEKTVLESTDEGNVANCIIHSSEAYHANYSPLGFSQSNGFLMNHFFHLVNPNSASQRSVKVCQLSSKSILNVIEKSKKHMFLAFRGRGNSEIGRLSYLIDNRRTNWIPSAEFHQEDHLMIVSCLFGLIAFPVPITLSIGRGLGTRNNSNTGSSNPAQAIRSGEYLEFITSISIVESSHYQCQNSTINLTLGGVGFNTFIGNMLFSIATRNFDDIFGKIPYIYEADPINAQMNSVFNVRNFMDTLRVPFLYPANVSLPQFLKTGLPLKYCTESSVKFGEYTRTANIEQVDALFDILQENPSGSSNFSLGKAIVECKNWAGNVPSSEIIKSLGKALRRQKALISLIICSSTFETVSSELNEYLNAKKINLYLIVLNKTSFSYKIVPINAQLHSNPNLVSLMFDLQYTGKKDKIRLAEEDERIAGRLAKTKKKMKEEAEKEKIEQDTEEESEEYDEKDIY